jgi:hypothetical protein
LRLGTARFGRQAQRAREKDLLEMATRALTQPSGNGSIGHSADLDTRTALNGHTAAAPASITAPFGSEIDVHGPAHDGAVSALALRHERMAPDRAGLVQRIEELETQLEQRSRRLQQLIGERDQLKALLARRDGELQRLNREIGALTARAAPTQVRSPALFAAARRLLDGLWQVRGASRRAKGSAPRPHQPAVQLSEPRLVPWAKQHPPKAICAVVVFGLTEAEIERVLEVVERYCAKHEAAPLLLTDNDSFQLFRNRRVLFEFLPPRSEQQRVAPDLDWQLFTLRRLALIRRKWRPVRVVPFGRRAAEVVQLWRDSPFEETPLPSWPGNQSLLVAGPAQQGVAA